MVQAADLWDRNHLAIGPRLDWARVGTILVEADFLVDLTPLASGVERRSGGGGALGPSEVRT